LSGLEYPSVYSSEDSIFQFTDFHLMTKKKLIKISLIIATTGFVGAISIAAYLFKKPHRNVQKATIDFTLASSALVQEYLMNAKVADQKYLDDSGDSKIMAVTGRVHSISRDMNQQRVVLLKDEGDKAGVSCTFSAASNPSAEKLFVGQTVTIKGVIRSGAGYDADLDLYEDVIIEKSDVIN
jgi:hypothetical protein